MSQINTRKKPLERDDSIQLPAVDIISASAGSGKTHTMAMRFTQFLLSSKIPNHDLKQILAITFTNLAAKELKERLILTLKNLALKDKKTTDYFTDIISIPRDQIPAKAERVLETMLIRYSDLQVKTIDSFFTQVFRSSAHDYGLYADCDITFQPQNILEHAFEELSKNIYKKDTLRHHIEQLIGILKEQRTSNQKYPWDPFQNIQDKIIRFYKSLQKQKGLLIQESQNHLLTEKKNRLTEIASELLQIINDTGLEVYSNAEKQLKNAMLGDFDKIINNKLYPSLFKDKQKKDKRPLLKEEYIGLHRQFNEHCIKYICLFSQNYYYPYIAVYSELTEYIKRTQRNLDEVALDDLHQYITSTLSGVVQSKADIIASVYERLGETICHYMIDEFQDTAPVHWNNLFPLIENTLAGKGSLFIVGDTKQSMYAFNDADWRILKGLTESIAFPSAQDNYSVSHLQDNYRSGGAIVEFNLHLFQEHIPSLYANSTDKKKISIHQKNKEALKAGGLIDYVQNPLDDKKNKGYVSVQLFETIETYKTELVNTIAELKKRGAPLKEIAVLTRRNEDIIDISETLRIAGIDCVSYSSLDIRKQALTAGVFTLLAFLDSPVDNLAFGRFLLSDLFVKASGKPADAWRDFIFRNRGKNLYTAFREEQEILWNLFFGELYKKTGYLTPYDLVCEIFTTFRLYKNFSDETATLTKFLETVKEFDKNGRGTLKEFLAFSEDDKDDSWNIIVSPDFDAVRLMTIHKAKGLNFGFVIAVFFDENRKGGEKMYFNENDDKVQILRMTSRIPQRIDDYSKFIDCEDHEYAFIKEIYDRQEQTDLVEWYNLRYVALTRPKNELYVYGVNRKDENKTDPTEPDEPVTENVIEKADPLDWLDVTEKILGTKAEIKKDDKPAPRILQPLFPETVSIQENFIFHKIRNNERYRGDNIHFVLSKTETLAADPEKQLRELAGKYALPRDCSLKDADFKAMSGLLLMPEMRTYFEEQPGRVIRNELDYIDTEGTHRIDRLVADPDEVTIIDYKTGETDDPVKYEKQIRSYMDFARAFYPGRSVKGILAYIDQKTIRVIS